MPEVESGDECIFGVLLGLRLLHWNEPIIAGLKSGVEI